MNSAAGLTYEQSGDVGDKTPVICLHGIGGNSRSFSHQLEGLSDVRRIISINLPGYGGSDQIDPLNFSGLAEKLITFLQALDIKKVHLVGQSIGGMIALETAALYPSFIKTLTLIATTPAFGGRDDSFKEKFIAARLKPLDAGLSLQELAQEFVPEIIGSTACEKDIVSAVHSMAAVPEETYRNIIQCLVTFNRRDALASLPMPCCLIAGEVDQNAPARTMEKMADKIPNAKFYEIAAAGHLVNLEAGDQTNEIISNFLSGH